jgi:uncharacterized membrane protein
MQSVKRLIENWIGAAPAAPGEDTQWTWRFHLGWPDWVLVLFAAAAAAFVVFFYLREGAATRSAKLFLASVRLFIIALLIVMLGELELSIDRTGLPYLVVGIDDSESQSLRRRLTTPSAAEDDESPTHQQRVLEWLSKDGGEQLKSLLDRYKLRFYAFSGSVRRVGDDVLNAEDLDRALVEVRKLTAKGGESAIGGAVREIVNDLRGAPPAAMILPTDGVVTAGEPLSQSAAFAARKQVSLFTIGAGDPEKPRDLELTDLLVDDTVFVGDDVTFEAKVIGRGLAGKDVPVSLKSPILRQPITQTIHIDADNKPVRVRLTYRPRQEGEQKPGMFPFTIETPTIERETNKDNNKLDRYITFVDERVRVLLVDAGPRYEMRYLKQLLDRQSSMEVKVLLWDADPEYVQQDRSAIGFFPANMEDLAKFDVVVLGDVKPSIFSSAQVEFVKNFVKRGGGLMVIAGPSYAPQTFKDSPLEDLLPIRLGNGGGDRSPTSGPFRPKVSPEGATSPVLRFDADDAENARIWASLQPMYWFSPVEKSKPAAQVLLEHPSEMSDGKPLPLLVSQFYGGGRTLFQAFDGTWRWRYQVEDLYHARYWIQAMRFLSRTKLLGKNRFAEIAVDRLRIRRGEPVQVRVQYLDESKAPTDEGVSAVVERTGRLGTRTTVDLKRSPSRRDVFEGVFTQTDDGEYRVRLAATGKETLNQTARFTVLPPPGELDNVQLNEEDLRAAAKATGGRYLPLDEADQVFVDGVLPFGRRVALNSEAPLALWRTWPTLLLFASLLLIEWLVRKRIRLV